MYNRYIGNTGKVIRVPDPAPAPQLPRRAAEFAAPPRPYHGRDEGEQKQERHSPQRETDRLESRKRESGHESGRPAQSPQRNPAENRALTHRSGYRQSSGLLSQIPLLSGSLFSAGYKKREDSSGLFAGLKDGLGGLLSKINPVNLETEDIILMLVLFLLYRESGDDELLIIMAAMLFL